MTKFEKTRRTLQVQNLRKLTNIILRFQCSRCGKVRQDHGITPGTFAAESHAKGWRVEYDLVLLRQTVRCPACVKGDKP